MAAGISWPREVLSSPSTTGPPECLPGGCRSEPSFSELVFSDPNGGGPTPASWKESIELDDLADILHLGRLEVLQSSPSPLKNSALVGSFGGVTLRCANLGSAHAFCATTDPALLTAVLVLHPRPLDGKAHGRALPPDSLLLYGPTDEVVYYSRRPLEVAMISVAAVSLLGPHLPTTILGGRRTPTLVTARPEDLQGLRDLVGDIQRAAVSAPWELSDRLHRQQVGRRLGHLLGTALGNAQGDRGIARPGGPACEWIVRRSLDFMRQRFGQALYVEDLCRALGVSERQLQTCFRSVLGVAPMHCLRLLRLLEVRHRLRKNMSSSPSVKSVALDCGFWDLGRFSMQYRQLFGEAPSTTMHKASFRGTFQRKIGRAAHGEHEPPSRSAVWR